MLSLASRQERDNQNREHATHVCQGCVDGNLGDFSGHTDRDMTFVANLEWDYGSEGELDIFGEGPGGTPYAMQATNAGTHTDVTLDGRVAFSNRGQGRDVCGFDLTYETVEPLMIHDFESGGDDVRGGEFNVTVNSTGDNYNVEFTSTGDVLVNGSPIPDEWVRDVEERCPSR